LALLALLVIAVVVLLAEPDPATTTTTAPPVIGPTSQPADSLDAFERGTVQMSGEVWQVAIASEPYQRAQGLMFVTSLGDLDGMLFVWEGDTTASFWMKDTPLELDIAFFRADGTLVDLLSMDPCTADPCPTYEASGAYRYAVEAARGAFDAMDQPFLRVDGQ
jgi:uncharacterized membrane protein (UPF0127 family)